MPAFKHQCEWIERGIHRADWRPASKSMAEQVAKKLLAVKSRLGEPGYPPDNHVMRDAFIDAERSLGKVHGYLAGENGLDAYDAYEWARGLRAKLGRCGMN